MGMLAHLGIPLEGARVQIEDSPLYRITGANGNYSFLIYSQRLTAITASN